jgi:gas vesicle protein
LEAEEGSDSGFEEFRQFLKNAVSEGDVWRMKVEGARDTAVKIAENLISRLRSEKAAIENDKAFYIDLFARVKSRRDKANALRRLAVDSLCVSYDRLAYKLEQDFAEGLSVGNILRRTIPFVRDKDIKTWLNELQLNFENTSKNEIETESSRVSKDISDELMSMFSELTEAIAHHHNSAIESFPVKDTDRVDILSRLKQQLLDLRISDITADRGIQGSDIGKLSLAGGGITALGAVIATATNMVIFDITGGILALGGLGIVAVTLIWKRSGILNDFSRKMSTSRKEFRERLDIEISRIFEKLFMEIEHRMKKPLSHLNEKSDRLVPLMEEAERVKKMAEEI